MNRLPESVNLQFNQLFAAIGQAGDDLKMATAEASIAGDFALVSANIEHYKQLQALEMEIKNCLNNFGNSSSLQTADKPFHKRSRRRSRKAGTRMRVRIAGRVIEQGTIAETFVETLKVFGLDKVAKLNKVVTSIPLMGRQPTNGYQAQRQVNGWYITTHVNKITATTVLEEIGQALNMPVKVEFADW
ncbi:hypothetical protein NP590_09410 [Methylomonas sp. SURF-2]|uniref:Uncharacterized protein n=1 Tax=Methylomonas subterranea TaxID=2952225 RepID=A0ABT1TFS6_9GAMM|nr:hypothetical protein [Methylomonas sp. SURF-2]MCQ8104320.1 hypothetical protein [Methylomonas sp. SURF-2]